MTRLEHDRISTLQRSPSAKKSRGLLAQTLLLATSSAIGQIIVATLYIWTARNELPESFGPVVAAIAIGTTLAGFIDFGSNSFWVRELATGRMHHTALGTLMGNKAFVCILVCLTWGGSFFAVIPHMQLWIAAPIAFSLVMSQSFVVPLRAAGRSDLVAATLVADRIVAVSVFAILLFSGAEAAVALWISMTVGPLAAAALSRWGFTGQVRPVLRLDVRANLWRGAGHYGLSSAAVGAQSLDVSILSAIAGPAAAGLYGAVNRWTQPMTLLAGAFAASSAPCVAKAGSWRKAWPKVRRSAGLLFIAITTCLTVAFYADTIVTLLVGAAYVGSGEVLKILALGTVGAVLNLPLAAFLQALGHDKIVSGIISSGVALQLILVSTLSLEYGALGASIAFGVLQALILVLLSFAAAHSRRAIPSLPSGRRFRQA